jgi:hypothetical protein
MAHNPTRWEVLAMTSSLFGAAVLGLSAGDTIANALDHLVDVGLMVLLATVALWAAATSIIVVRDRWR